MKFRVRNNSLLYGFFRKGDCSDKQQRLIEWALWVFLTLPITVWDIIDQQFDTYHQRRVPITENSLGTHAIGHEVAVSSGHHYLHVDRSDFPDNYAARSIQYTIPWEEGQISNNWFNTPKTSQVSSP